jgi:hypothetical protein
MPDLGKRRMYLQPLTGSQTMSRKRNRVWAVHGVYPPKDFPAHVIGHGRRNQAARKASAGSVARLRPDTPGKPAPTHTGTGPAETQGARNGEMKSGTDSVSPEPSNR